MDCKIIKDLIPLSEEGLCSEESKAMIEEHIKDCENCRLLYEKIPQAKITAEVPDEKETFKKVNRKMKKLTWKSTILGLLLIIILLPLGYLTFGQITKMEETQSFETVAQSFEVRKMAKYIAKEDFDSLIKHHGHSIIEELLLFGEYYTDEIRELDKKYLSESYEQTYGNTEVKDISVKSMYMVGGQYGNASVPVHQACIEYEDGQKLKVTLIKESNGLYKIINVFDGSEDGYTAFTGSAEEKPFIDALVHFSYHKKFLISSDYPKSYYEDDFKGEYYDNYIKCRRSFNDSGFTIDNIYQSINYEFDEEKNMLYYDVAVKASDEKGTAIMTTRLYYDYLGFYSPERDTISVITDGCTAELEEAMYTFFG